MNRRIKKVAASVSLVVGLGIIGAGCLVRPIEHQDPTIKVNFTTVVKNQSVDKIDLLFMIDNSASMGDKQQLLAAAVPDMIDRLIAPNCVDASGKYLGPSTNSACTMFPNATLEFPAVHDMHIGIVTSSLGGRGGDQCNPADKNMANPQLGAHNDDRGELVNRSGDLESLVSDANPDNFLGWFPPVQANMGKMAPSGAPLASLATLKTDFTGMVSGVHEHGCGFEAQNEAWYRFLVQPDPFDHIQVTNNVAQPAGIDATILKQRADFLRQDSLVAVIVVTDENEEVADPAAIQGQGWVFENSQFPGSPNYAAPEGTIECSQQDPNNPTTTGPYGPNCTSCAFIKNDPNFKTRCPNDPPSGTGGWLDPSDDALNVRFFNQKKRFGIFVGYPTSRYVRALSKPSVPDFAHEHDKNGRYIGDQDVQANCVNPLFATNLPTNPSSDLCGLQRGSRTPDLLYYAAIAGVPHQLLQQDPSNPDSPQKDILSDADWKLILGTDPEHFDFRGVDFHMVESTLPRTAQNLPPGTMNSSNCPPGSADNCDPINGREWDTKKADLQFACIFKLPMAKDCSQQQFSGACDCQAMGTNQQTQLCEMGGGNYSTIQINGKAYPSVREMIIAHAMGPQGIVSSLCPIHVVPAMGDNPQDTLYGYRPAINTIINRLKASLSNQCLPQKLNQDPNDLSVPCLILVTLPGAAGNCLNPNCDPTQGLEVPPQAILTKFCQAQEAAWQVGGGANSAATEPMKQDVCALKQLTPATNGGAFSGPAGAQSCANPPDNSLGWCYVEGAAAGSCPQAILFTNGEPPHGATVNLQCIEQSVTVVGEGGGGGGGGGMSSSGATTPASSGGASDSGATE